MPGMSPFNGSAMLVCAAVLVVALQKLRRRHTTVIETEKASARNVKLNSAQLGVQKAAEKAARTAGHRIAAALGTINLHNQVESKIGQRDIVTSVDKEAQDIIQTIVHESFPTHKFLGEEDVEPGIEASKTAMDACKNEANLWIVDPIDGTTNFAHGIPLCGVIIAYAEYGEVKFGLIFDPTRNEMFTAWKGNGAYMNETSISCCRASSLGESVICTGSPPNLQNLAASLRGMETLSPMVRSMRVIGSAAQHLSWVACGRLSAYFEADLNSWDVAAGALLVKEAGGKVTDVWGKEHTLSARNTVASNGALHDELLRLLLASKMHL